MPISLHSGLNHNRLHKTFNRASRMYREAWQAKI